ncbi:MAG: type II toxin-antitoxin system YafQ family toxin [Hyphomicrobiales bacterium]|nr:type II toxin-antitoxin system YafQ family toxin [Hyphomicrobiales bacterium]
MREIERTTQFKRDYRREMKGRHRVTLETTLTDILRDLITDVPLAENRRDHSLSGNWSGFRDCHFRPDLVLIYEKPDEKILRLIRLGSHSELGL